MNKLSIELKNCFGIKKLEKEFTFKANVNVIYAKNGLMKTSFAKVFKKIQDGKASEIEDLIFDQDSKHNIKIDNNNIKKEEIFVINSFEKAYESDSISSLLIDESMKTRFTEIIGVKNNIFNNLKNKSGLSIDKAVSSKGFLKLEEQVSKDFNFDKNDFLQNCENIVLDTVDYDFSNINYSFVFHKAVLNNIGKDSFQKHIKKYIEKSEEIYKEYTFFDKGKFNLPKLKSIEKELKASNFFIKENKIYLDGSGEFSDINLLQEKIKEVEGKLQDTKEFKVIDTALGTKDGRSLKDIIENNIEIIEELKLDKLEEFRKRLWLSYLKEDEEKFNNLKNKFIELKDEISKLKIDETLWKKSIKIFNDRFDLPFTMDVDNPINSIIGESLPRIIFAFENDGKETRLNRDELEKKDTLSQGEKRALYLLNIIFDIEKRKKENQKTLFIIDDIADSFDYKNKYAIIEYLNDISKQPNFYMIILSHNFDFYRTISSRLSLTRDNKFHAIKINNEIKIEKEHYQNQPFKNWKDNLNQKKNIIALIPFVRNLIEYGIEKQVNTYPNIDKDYILLTNLLHLKDDTKNIKFEQLKLIYKAYLDKDKFDSSINLTDDKVYDLIIDIANNDISDNDINLENKIILAIAIRLKAEKFMIKAINNPSWLNEISKSQTRELFTKYKTNFGNETSKIKILESVNIMTPENIHLNSFMYEPLLDMDIIELKKLYENVKSL